MHTSRTLPAAVLLAVTALPSAVWAQRSGKQSAHDLFYAEAGLIVPPQSRKGRFAAAKNPSSPSRWVSNTTF
jgi:hypothetical protein